MFSLLDFPSLPPDQRAQAELQLRYEDVDQDGRMQCAPVTHAVGISVWQQLLAKHPLTAWCRTQHVLPILSRLVIERGEGPISVEVPLAVEGGYELSHVPGPTPGTVERIVLSMWATLEGKRGRTYGMRTRDEGTPTRVARMYGEHVFTAPFAPPDRRKVTRLEVDGLPAVPLRVHVAPPSAGYAVPPPGALTLGEAVDEPPFLFGLMHTDANQHVNSLVYVRRFEEAALRRLAALGDTGTRLARLVEIGYRKPFFAGQRGIFRVQAFALGDTRGVCGTISPDEADARASSYVRITF